jgi:hypothetical protein
LLNQLPLMEWRPSILPKLKQKRRRQQTLQSLQKYKQRALPCSDLNCLQSNLKSKPKLNWLFSSLISPRSTGLDTNWAMVLTVFFLMTQRRLLCTQISSILITLKGTSRVLPHLPRMKTMPKKLFPSSTSSSSLRASTKR